MHLSLRATCHHRCPKSGRAAIRQPARLFASKANEPTSQGCCAAQEIFPGRGAGLFRLAIAIGVNSQNDRGRAGHRHAGGRAIGTGHQNRARAGRLGFTFKTKAAGVLMSTSLLRNSLLVKAPEKVIFEPAEKPPLAASTENWKLLHDSTTAAPAADVASFNSGALIMTRSEVVTSNMLPSMVPLNSGLLNLQRSESQLRCVTFCVAGDVLHCHDKLAVVLARTILRLASTEVGLEHIAAIDLVVLVGIGIDHRTRT